jgi:dolichol-phosphate mannosyltransferase
MGRRVVDVMNSLPEKNRFVRGLRSWSGFAQTGIAYERSPRAAGEPKYGLLKLARLAFDGIVNFSTAPLTLIFWLGVTTAALALLAAVLYLGARILDVPIFGHAPGEAPGFTTLILTMLFLGGVQLISVGILGQYLGRIYEETKMRPSFLVKGVRGGAPRPPDSRGAE